MKQNTSAVFLLHADLPKINAGKGITRQLLGYDESLMLARVKFETGAISEKHAHHHSQSTYVVSGKFQLTVGEESMILSAGDGFYIPPNIVHGAVCLEEGILIDAFSPCREDFL